MDWYFEVWRKAFEFSGRSRRKEYWFFFLVNFIIGLMRYIQVPFLWILLLIYSLAAFIPTLAVTARRLHDTNHSGWWILIGLIPLCRSYYSASLHGNGQ